MSEFGDPYEPYMDDSGYFNGGDSGLYYDPSTFSSSDVSWDSVLNIPADEQAGFSAWLQQNYPDIAEQIGGGNNLDEQVWNATGGQGTSLIPGVNSMYDFNTGEYVPAILDDDGNLMPVLSGGVSSSSGTSGGFDWSKLIPSGNTLANLAGLVSGGALGNLGYQQAKENVEKFNAGNFDRFMRLAGSIIPEQYMPSVNGSNGKPLTNSDGSPLQRAAGGQSGFMQRPDVQAIISNHDRMRNTPRPYAEGGKTGGMNAIKQDKVAQRYLKGAGGGQDDNIIAAVSPNEYIFDADVVAALGDGSPDEGARKLDQMRENIRQHKRSAPKDKIPPKAKSPEQYMKGSK